MKLITIDHKSSLPKYKQIVLSVEIAISTKKLKLNEKLPSVNKLKIEHQVSRDTILQAYNELKKRGIIYSILGKGYFVKSIEFSFEQRYFVVFDEFNSFKEDLYYSFLKTINNKAQVDIYFHHFNIELFKKLINESNGNYSKYIIMPSNMKEISEYIKKLPKEDVYILDQINEELLTYSGIYQNFEKDIYEALYFGKELLANYQKLILLFPNIKEPEGMKIGFIKFCKLFNFDFEIISNTIANDVFDDIDLRIKGVKIKKGVVYIIPNDRDLVNIIKKAKEKNFIIGVDIGIISYNDTMLKKIVENGITTISTNFNKMGILLAKMIMNQERSLIENESKLIVRNSL